MLIGHNWMVLSLLPLASIFPSSEMVNERIVSEWPVLTSCKRAHVGDVPNFERVWYGRRWFMISTGADQVSIRQLQKASDTSFVGLLFGPRLAFVVQVDYFDGSLFCADCDLAIRESEYWPHSLESSWKRFDQLSVIWIPNSECALFFFVCINRECNQVVVWKDSKRYNPFLVAMSWDGHQKVVLGEIRVPYLDGVVIWSSWPSCRCLSTFNQTTTSVCPRSVSHFSFVSSRFHSLIVLSLEPLANQPLGKIANEQTRIGVGFQGEQLFSTRCVPNFDRFIFGTADQAMIGQENCLVYCFRMAGECLLKAFLEFSLLKECSQPNH